MDASEQAEMGIAENVGEYTQLVDDLKAFSTKIVEYLLQKVDSLDDPDDIKNLRQIEEVHSDQKNKMAGLQKQEEEYNKNVQVVVESDEQQMKLNDVITQLKKEIADISAKLENASKEFKEVRQSRKDTFLDFFDLASQRVGDVYRRMSGEQGSASITLLDREQPFGQDDEIAPQNIIYEFKPPNKQFDSDIQARSGGEKTIAGLALIFALAQLKRSPFILLDEGDAHLDPENVKMLAGYLEQWETKP